MGDVTKLTFSALSTSQRDVLVKFWKSTYDQARFGEVNHSRRQRESIPATAMERPVVFLLSPGSQTDAEMPLLISD